MLIESSISKALVLLSGKKTSIHENSELQFFKFIRYLHEISNNWPNDLLGTNKYKLDLADNRCWQYDNGLILIQNFLNEAHFHRFHL